MDAEVPFADAKRDNPQNPASLDAMSETDCNSITKESAIHEANDCPAQFARADEKDHNMGSGSELPYVKCAAIGGASTEENLPPCTIDKTSEIMATEAPLSAQADTEASGKVAVVSSCEATSGNSSEGIKEESTLSSRKEAPEGHTQTDAEQKPLLNQGPDGLSLEHTETSVEVQDLSLRTSSDTCHLKQETNIELSKEGNLDVELATDPTRNEEIHTEVSTTDSSISGDAFLESIPESCSSVAAQFEDTSLAVNQRGEVEDASVAGLSSDKQLKDVPVSFSSPAVPPSSSSVEVASSKPPVSNSSDVGSSERNQTLDITVDNKLSSKVASSDCGDSSEDGVCVEGAEDSSILSVAAKAAAGSDLEGGHEASADTLDCAGHISTGSDQENFDEEFEMHPQLSRDYTDDDNGIDEGTRGLEDELQDGLDEEEDEDCLKGERQQGDGEESVDPSNIQDKVLDFDEDKRNPQYIPKKGAFYQHDDRMVGDEGGSEVPEEKNEDDKGSRRQKKLWHDEGVWGHDMYREEEQGPKTSAELVSIYGYDIRTETMPPRARRRRRYGRGPNKYQRNWEDEEAYTPRSGSGRGGVRGGVRGGRRTRGGSHLGNPPFHDEDFPDLNPKVLNSEKPVTVQQDKAEEKQSARPTVFKGSDSPLSSSSHQEEWDHTVKGSGMTHRGWGKRPSQPRRVPDALPRQEDSDVKENVSLAHRISRPGSRSPVKANEPPHNLPSTGRNRAVRHLLTEHERNKKDFEALEKLASKVELDDGDAVDLKRSTAATVTPRGGPIGSTESAAKPKRYSSLRLRPLAEAASYTETAVVTPQLPNTQAPLPAPNQPQPAILAAAPFPGPYAPYPDGYMLPPGQPPAVMPTQSQPPPVMTAPSPLTSSFLPPPTGIVSFPPQYPPPYTFPAQYAAPAAAAAPPTTQAQKPPYYHGDIIYYNTQSQQHKQRPTPPRRPKAAIPIVPPPDSQSTAQESTPEPDGSTSHQSKSDEDLDNVAGPKPTVQDGPTAQQAVGGL